MSDPVFRIIIDPMVKLRAQTTQQVNDHFNRLAAAGLHRDQAHAAKRETARAVLAGTVLPPDHPFALEAALRGMTVLNHAGDIASRPETLQRRELQRQQAMTAIAQASVPDQLESILKGLPDG